MTPNHHPAGTMSRDGTAPGRPSPAPGRGVRTAQTCVGFEQCSRARNARRLRTMEARMGLLGLGYAGFGSDSLEDWRQFGTGLVGLQAVERGNSLLAFRMDDRKQRIVI